MDKEIRELMDAQAATWEHILNVRKLGEAVTEDWAARLINHDASKLSSPEAEMFAVFTPRLKAMTYGSDEYQACLKEMGVALKHHYENNTHHPEHYEDGIAGMTLLDLLEMLIDWKAATLRHTNGNLKKSMEISVERFRIDSQLKAVLENTAMSLGCL